MATGTSRPVASLPHAVGQPPPARASYSREVFLALVSLLAVGMFGPTLLELREAWRDPNYSHGWLVIPFCAFLIYRYLEDNPLGTSRDPALGCLSILAGSCRLHPRRPSSSTSPDRLRSVVRPS